MNKNNLTKFIVSILFTITLFFMKNSLAVAQNAQTNLKASDTVNVVAIDLSGDGLINEESILWGNDAILAIDLYTKSSPENISASSLGYFTSMSMLDRMDDNADGDIDELDAAYPKMRLLFFYNGGKKFKIVSFLIPGLHSIFLERARMLVSPVNPPGFADDEPSTAVLSDSSRRKLLIISIKKEIFNNIK